MRLTYPVWRLTEKLNANKTSLHSAALESNALTLRRSEFTFPRVESGNVRGANLVALLLQFGHETFLLQGGAAPEQFQKRIIHFIARLVRAFLLGFELLQIRQQSAW